MPGKRVFVCSPYRGSTPAEQEANVAQAREFLGHCLRQGNAGFAPHLLYPGLLNDADERERNQGINAGLSFLLSCHELWWLDTSRGVTSGMRKELELATVAGLAIRRYRLVDLGGNRYFEDAGGDRLDFTWQYR